MNTMKRLMAGMLFGGILTMAAGAATTNDMDSGSGYGVPAGAQKATVVCGEVKFLDASTHVAFDVYKAITIPSNTYVRKVYMHVVTTNTGSSVKLSVGDSGATNTYMLGTTFGTVGFTACTNAYDTANGHLYTDADFISVVPNVATTDGVVRIYAEMLPLRK